MRYCIAILLSVLIGGSAFGQTNVIGQITKRDGAVLKGTITWHSASQTYRLVGSSMLIAIPISEIQSVQVKRPDHIDLALKMIERGDYTTAIPILQKIIQNYTMLQWDQPAYRWLAECYLRTAQPQKVLTTYDQAVNATRSGPDDDFKLIYLSALLDLGEFNRAREGADTILAEEGKARFEEMLKQRGAATTNSTFSSEAAPSAAPSER